MFRISESLVQPPILSSSLATYFVHYPKISLPDGRVFTGKKRKESLKGSDWKVWWDILYTKDINWQDGVVCLKDGNIIDKESPYYKQFIDRIKAACVTFPWWYFIPASSEKDVQTAMRVVRDDGEEIPPDAGCTFTGKVCWSMDRDPGSAIFQQIKNGVINYMLLRQGSNETETIDPDAWYTFTDKTIDFIFWSYLLEEKGDTWDGYMGIPVDTTLDRKHRDINMDPIRTNTATTNITSEVDDIINDPRIIKLKGMDRTIVSFSNCQDSDYRWVLKGNGILERTIYPDVWCIFIPPVDGVKPIVDMQGMVCILQRGPNQEDRYVFLNKGWDKIRADDGKIFTWECKQRSYAFPNNKREPLLQNKELQEFLRNNKNDEYLLVQTDPDGKNKSYVSVKNWERYNIPDIREEFEDMNRTPDDNTVISDLMRMLFLQSNFTGDMKADSIQDKGTFRTYLVEYIKSIWVHYSNLPRVELFQVFVNIFFSNIFQGESIVDIQSWTDKKKEEILSGVRQDLWDSSVAVWVKEKFNKLWKYL